MFGYDFHNLADGLVSFQFRRTNDNLEMDIGHKDTDKLSAEKDKKKKGNEWQATWN